MEVEISRSPMQKNHVIVLVQKLVCHCSREMRRTWYLTSPHRIAESQNYRMIEAWRDLCRSSCPCPLLKEDHLYGVQVTFEYLQGWSSITPWSSLVHKCPCPDHLNTNLLLLVIVWMWECKGMQSLRKGLWVGKANVLKRFCKTISPSPTINSHSAFFTLTCNREKHRQDMCWKDARPGFV